MNLIEQLEKLLVNDYGRVYELRKDLRAIIEQHKSQPNIVAELVKALADDTYAASFQSMAGYRKALIAKVKGMVG